MLKERGPVVGIHSIKGLSILGLHNVGLRSIYPRVIVRRSSPTTLSYTSEKKLNAPPSCGKCIVSYATYRVMGEAQRAIRRAGLFRDLHEYRATVKGRPGTILGKKFNF